MTRSRAPKCRYQTRCSTRRARAHAGRVEQLCGVRHAGDVQSDVDRVEEGTEVLSLRGTAPRGFALAKYVDIPLLGVPWGAQPLRDGVFSSGMAGVFSTKKRGGCDCE